VRRSRCDRRHPLPCGRGRYVRCGFPREDRMKLSTLEHDGGCQRAARGGAEGRLLPCGVCRKLGSNITHAALAIQVGPVGRLLLRLARGDSEQQTGNGIKATPRKTREDRRWFAAA
jgi:hypothetical protein